MPYTNIEATAERADDVGAGDVEASGAEPAMVRASAEHRGELVGHRASRYRPLRMLAMVMQERPDSNGPSGTIAWPGQDAW